MLCLFLPVGFLCQLLDICVENMNEITSVVIGEDVQRNTTVVVCLLLVSVHILMHWDCVLKWKQRGTKLWVGVCRRIGLDLFVQSSHCSRSKYSGIWKHHMFFYIQKVSVMLMSWLLFIFHTMPQCLLIIRQVVGKREWRYHWRTMVNLFIFFNLIVS